MQITIEVDSTALAEAIHPDDAENIVKRIDEQMGDYEWTLHLVRYLVGELIKCCEEDGETFDVSSVLPDKWGK